MKGGSSIKIALRVLLSLLLITLLTGCVHIGTTGFSDIIDLPQDCYPTQIVASNFGDYIGECIIEDGEVIEQIIDILAERKYHYSPSFLPESPGSTPTVLELRYESRDTVSFCLGSIPIDNLFLYELDKTDSVEGIIINYGLNTEQLVPR